jgi:DNA-binding helix-hairpin-helix protein with protein kinase domain/Tfp pilus assembly protein PilF
MPLRPSSHIYDSHGRKLTLGDKIAQGGEGAVFDLVNQRDQVAKIYHTPVNDQKVRKLSSMVSLKTERLLNLAAWPIDTLHDKPGGRMVGLLMAKVQEHKEVHQLYAIKSRLIHFPHAQWPFLIHAAANIARAVNVMHEHGHVIGDINHASVGISRKGTATLFDCDSFQITTAASQYLCEVGQDTHTPPELQGMSFRGLVRSKNHDAFGLAVVIFQLLFLGRHPFAGQFLGASETASLPKFIREYRFAYGPGATSRQMRQPPGTLDLGAVSPTIANLFERAFLPGKNRPSPHEWILGLDQLAGSLTRCRINASHYFWNGLTVCPWCKIEAQTAIVIFTQVAGVVHQDGTFSLTVTWSLIDSIPPPLALPSLPNTKDFHLKRSVQGSEIRQSHLLRALSTTAVLIALSLIVLTSSVSASSSAWIIVIAGGIGLVIANSGNNDSRRQLESERRAAHGRLREAERRWQEQAGSKPFDDKKRQLEAQKTEYLALAALRQRKLNELQTTIRQRQLHKFLDRHLISHARISGIGPGRQAILSSYGIDTAADIDRRTIAKVYGFGPVYTSNLLSWRSSIEQRFVFNPAIGIDPDDKRALENEIVTTRARLEKELQNGPSDLRRINHQILIARSTMLPIIETNIKAAAQADLDAGSNLSRVVGFGPLLLTIAASLILILPLKVTRSRQALTTPVGAVPIATPTPTSTPTPSLDQLRAEAKFLYTQGRELTKARKYVEAATTYQQAITIDPRLTEAHHELAFALFKLGKYQDSIVAAQEAIKLRSDNPDTYRILGWSLSGMRRWKEAIEAFELSLQLEPDSPRTYYSLGLAAKGSGEIDSALAAFKEAINLKPDYAAAHFELGQLYLDLGETQLATEEYETLSPLNPKLAQRLAKRLDLE